MKKYLNLRLITLLHCALVLTVCLFPACKKHQDKIATATDDNGIPFSIIERLKKDGYSINGIIAYKDGYIVEGDIILSKADLTNTSPRMAQRGEERKMANNLLFVEKIAQYRTTNLVSGFTPTNPRTITVSLASGFPTAYSTALDAALARYNTVGLGLNFVTTSGTADIAITINNSLPSGVYGGSNGFPSATGDPNHSIEVNVSYIGNNPNMGFLTTFFAHEIGHCIGFRHTDYFDRSFSNCQYASQLYNGYDEQSGTVGAIHIPGTPTAGDPGSWMLACSGQTTDRPFNANDITALKALYPRTYTNVEKSKIFLRDNCSGGYAGTAVTYTVAANTYTSAIDQADADQKALNDINANGQAYANANGTCVLASTFTFGRVDYPAPPGVSVSGMNPVTVQFLQNSAVVRKVTIPLTGNISEAITPGTYNLKFIIPSVSYPVYFYVRSTNAPYNIEYWYRLSNTNTYTTPTLTFSGGSTIGIDLTNDAL
ncbi:MAG: hypothetical protein J7599_01965 [Niabella sp.]|nr:hypothetical protein [Niabella sp.]